MGRRRFEGGWWKSRGLRELRGLRQFGETVEMCGKVKTRTLEKPNTKGTAPEHPKKFQKLPT